MSKINLTTVKGFGKKYGFDTFLFIFFDALMARGIIDALRFFRTVAVFIPMIMIVWLLEKHQHIKSSQIFEIASMKKAV